MSAYLLPRALKDEVLAVLAGAGRNDLVVRIQAGQDTLSSGQAAQYLGVSSPNTVKRWLEGGQFPGAFRTQGGHWRFVRAEVEAVKERMDALRERRARGGVSFDPDADYEDPPLL